MVYVTGDGSVKNKKDGIVTMIVNFFMMIFLFFQSLLGLDSSQSRDARDNRDHLRRANPGGGGRWDGAGLGGGGTGGGGGGGGVGRRPIGRLPGSSGIAPPPMGGGCCGGGGCG